MRKIQIFGLLIYLLSTGCVEDKFEPQLFGSLVGTVLTTEDNIAIAEATISTNPPTSSLQTDDLGRFTIDAIETGTYTIRAEKEGFITEVENVTVLQDQSANVILKLAEESEVNNPPDMPLMPMPSTGTTETETELLLSWTATDADNDDLTFDVILCESASSVCDTLAFDLEESEFMVQDLKFETVYFWQIKAKDGFTSTNSELWTFKTMPFPDYRFLCSRKIEGKFEIFSSDEEGVSNVRLTEGPGDSWRPRLSFQRDKIAFLRNAGIETHLYTMNRDGSNIVQVSAAVPVSGLNPLELSFAWSPNGAELVYPAGSELYKIGVDGIGLTKIADAPEGQMFAEVDWSQSGGQLVVRTTGNNVYDSDMFLLDSDGTFIQQIYANIPGRETGPQFSIDGNSILYTHDVEGYEAADGRQLAAHIFLKNLTDNSVYDISEEGNILAGTNDTNARFSPDGSKVVFVNTNNDGISQKNIFVSEIDGGGRQVLFLDAVMPDWR